MQLGPKWLRNLPTRPLTLETTCTDKSVPKYCSSEMRNDSAIAGQLLPGRYACEVEPGMLGPMTDCTPRASGSQRTQARRGRMNCRIYPLMARKKRRVRRWRHFGQRATRYGRRRRPTKWVARKRRMERIRKKGEARKHKRRASQRIKSVSKPSGPLHAARNEWEAAPRTRIVVMMAL